MKTRNHWDCVSIIAGYFPGAEVTRKDSQISVVYRVSAQQFAVTAFERSGGKALLEWLSEHTDCLILSFASERELAVAEWVFEWDGVPFTPPAEEEQKGVSGLVEVVEPYNAVQSLKQNWTEAGQNMVIDLRSVYRWKDLERMGKELFSRIGGNSEIEVWPPVFARGDGASVGALWEPEGEEPIVLRLEHQEQELLRQLLKRSDYCAFEISNPIFGARFALKFVVEGIVRTVT